MKFQLWRVLRGFMIGILGFGVISMFWVPGWPLDWLRQGASHAGDLSAEPWLIQVLRTFSSTPRIGLLGAILLIGMIIAGGLVFMRWWQGKMETFFVLAYFVLLTQAVNTLSHLPEQIIFLLPILASLQGIQSRWKHVIWVLFLVIPVVGFWITFIGYEAFEASLFVPGAFLAWILALRYLPNWARSLELSA